MRRKEELAYSQRDKGDSLFFCQQFTLPWTCHLHPAETSHLHYGKRHLNPTSFCFPECRESYVFTKEVMLNIRCAPFQSKFLLFRNDSECLSRL
ncbi:Ankyrin-2 [Manis pentadactyla]|nr:Ankyrin-2 [Manis pentadactyla]